MKSNIKRSDFKYNFLKKVMIRIDYTGVLDLDLEETIKNLKDILYNSGFIKFKEGFLNKVDFEINDPELIETNMMIPVSELKKTKSYVFSTNDLNQSIQITKYFAILNIDLEHYIDFQSYGTLFSEISKTIKDTNKFLRILRIGLRKINNCILLDICKLNNFFEEKYFNNVINDFHNDSLNIDLINSQKSDSFHVEYKDVNLIRYLSKGILEINNEEKEAYQVVLDIDVYIKDEETINNIFNQHTLFISELNNMNTLLFKIYVQMLKTEFLEKLKSDDFNENIILGVEKND